MQATELGHIGEGHAPGFRTHQAVHAAAGPQAHRGGHTGVHFPPFSGDARSGRTCSPRSLSTTDFFIPASGRPSHGGRAHRPSKGAGARNGGQGAGQREEGRPSSTMGGARLFLSRRAGGMALPLRRRPFGACSPLRRGPAQRAFPRSQWRAGTQRANGKARNAADVCGAASGRQRPGADSRRGSRARQNREPGPSLRSFLSPPFQF